MDELIISTINKNNPWHDATKGLAAFKAGERKLIEREVQYKALSSLNPSSILGLIGPRRVGKSAIMDQMMVGLSLRPDVEPQQIIFMNCDEYTLHSLRLFDHLHSYCSDLFAVPFDEIKKPLYIFLDEVTALPDWERLMKIEIDFIIRHDLPFHFIVASSSSLKLEEGGRSTLVGRLNTMTVWPFSFFESLELKMKLDQTAGKYSRNIQSLREQLRGIPFDGGRLSPKGKLIERFSDVSRSLSDDFRGFLVDKLHEYLLEGGFPDYIKGKERNYFTQIIGMTVEKDLSRQYNLTAVSQEKIARLLNRLIYSNGGTVDVRKLTSEIEEEHPSRVSLYFSYLQKTGLVTFLTPMVKPANRERKTKRKVMFLDSGLVNEITGTTQRLPLTAAWDSHAVWNEEKGPSAETMVLTHLKRLKPWPVFYSRDEKESGKVGEVDFIWETPGFPLPIECKTGNPSLNQHQYASMAGAVRGMKAEYGLVLTENTLKAEGDLLYVPLYLFLGASDD